MTTDQIEELRLSIAPFKGFAALDADLAKLGDVLAAVAAEERQLEKLKRECRAKQEAIGKLNAAITASQGKAVEMETAARTLAERLRDEAIAERDRLVAAGKTEAERIIGDAQARAATIEEALSGAQSQLLRARRVG
jgi:hypothetical protein